MPSVNHRKPLQGLCNVLRFNWHFYVISLLAFAILIIAGIILPNPLATLSYLAALACGVITTTSLLVTAYVYDFSNFYQLEWITIPEDVENMIHFSAGFDETSNLLSSTFPDQKIHLYDIYESLGKKEISIQRAQKAYPPPEDIMSVPLDSLPIKDKSIHNAIAILALHEIRDEESRIQFFTELHRIIHPSGRIYIAEHLRDFPNFLGYTIGFFHFLPRSAWLKTFQKTGWTIAEEKKHTAFINIFILEK